MKARITASLLLSAMRILKVELMTDETNSLAWNSPCLPLSPVFLKHLTAHRNDLKGLLKLRCSKCRQSAICEEGEKYFYAYCPNGHGYIRKEAKEGFPPEEAHAEFEQISFEIEERLALMTEDGRDETEVINELCCRIITVLFKTDEVKARGVTA